MTSITNLKSQWEQQARDDERDSIVENLRNLESFAASKKFAVVLREKFLTILFKIRTDIENNCHRKANTNEV